MAARTLRDRQTHEPIGAVTFSAGLATMTAAGGLPEALREADAALYAAKRGGRNQIYGAYGRGVLASL
jgi:diguanylate cyclase